MKAPILFEPPVAELNHKQRQIKERELQRMFTIKPNAGQIWITKGELQPDGTRKGGGKKLTIHAIANTSPSAPSEPLVIFRNEKKELNSWPMNDWLTENDVELVE